MIEENILYKLIDNKYHFFYYSIYIESYGDKNTSQITRYGIEYTQGEVGEFPDSDCGIFENFNEVINIKDELVKLYTITNIPSYEVAVSVNLSDLLKRIPKKKHLPYIHHISRTIEFVCKSSGIGINNFITPSDKATLEKSIYHTLVSVYDKDAFCRLFIDHIILCGIREDEVVFS
jgi:hypothetical protein